jgi:hypothetical protein
MFSLIFARFYKGFDYYYLTAIRLTPGGSSIYLRTNSTQSTEDGTHNNYKENKNNYKEKNWEVNWEVRAVPRLCKLYPGICLTTEEKAWKNLS